MNRQEAFDKACKGIIAQGCRSQNDEGCLYRATNGARCAVGHLITDAQFDRYRVINSCSVYSLDEELLKELLPDESTDEASRFLRDLQLVHDNSDPSDPDGYVASFMRRALKFADAYDLRIPGDIY